MRLFLSGESAFQWWIHAQECGCDAVGFEALQNCAPVASSVRYVMSIIPFLEQPISFVVSRKEDYRHVKGAVVRMSGYAFSKRSFSLVAHGIYVASPELCFVQAAAELPFLECVRRGFLLCSRFAIDENASTGLVERKPLTSISELGDYFDANAGLRGVSSARRALMFVQENAASPREIDLAMRLCLPQAKGGFGFAGALLNYRIDLGSRARLVAGSRYYVADMCWPKEKLVVEYDSDLHLSSKQLAHDAVKRGALTEMGYRIITVTRLQLDSPVEMRKVAIQIAHRLRKRLRIRSSQFRQRQEDLFGL